MSKQSLVCLDIGERRIGVAVADTSVRIAIPYDTIEVSGTEIRQIAEIATREDADIIVVGYPRNQQGEATAQTQYVEKFADLLRDIAKIEFQDESLTSVHAEKRLQARNKHYSKADIDKEAAAIILQDYLEEHYAA